MKRLGLLLLLLGCLTAQAQFRDMNRSANWIFGNKAGLHFVGYADSIPGNERVELFTPCPDFINKEGVSTLSDEAGKLLFYSSGTQVWNAAHDTMQNGSNLQGSFSSTQTSVIVPQPGNPNQYYLFSSYHRGEGAFTYSKIDMSLNGGLGAVTEKGVNLGFNSEEKIAAVRHTYKDAYWVVTRRYKSNQFQLFLIDETGFANLPTEISIQPIGVSESPAAGMGQGAMCFSPDGRRMAIVQQDSGIVQVFRFNPATGKIYDPMSLRVLGVPYGIAISSDGSKLYVSEWGTPSDRVYLYQFDLRVNGANSTSEEIQASRTNVAVLRKVDPGLAHAFGTIQQGPDGRLYVAKDRTSADMLNVPSEEEMIDTGVDFLGVIEWPNRKGLACSYVADGQALGTCDVDHNGAPVEERYSHRRTRLGLPAFIDSWVNRMRIVFWATSRTLPPGGNTKLYTLRDPHIDFKYQWLKMKMDLSWEAIVAATDTSLIVNTAGTYALALAYEEFADTSAAIKIELVTARPQLAELTQAPAPNPAADRLTLHAAHAGSAVLCDLLGRPTARVELTAGENVVYIGGVAPGVYVLRVEAPGRAAATYRVAIGR